MYEDGVFVMHGNGLADLTLELDHIFSRYAAQCVHFHMDDKHQRIVKNSHFILYRFAPLFQEITREKHASFVS